MKKLMVSFAKKFGLEIRRYSPKVKVYIGEIASLKTKNARQGSMLLSYIIDPFLLKDGEPISNAHTHDFESLLIAETFLDLGYDVDVIDYRDELFTPIKEYSFFVSARTNFQRIAKFLHDDCIKIVHLDMAHWLFNNYAAYKRCLDVKERKGIALRSYKMQEMNWAIEYADYATILGNEFTISTYKYAQKPLFRTPISTCYTYPWSRVKDFDNCRRNFLWLGSSGFIHKGLDLVVESFMELPDCHLYICGPIEGEKDFQRAFHKELYETKNIHTIGWVDVTSPEFIEITNKCVGVVYASCSEGGGGAVIQCMHAGLIPIVSYESSVDVADFGVILKNCSISEIKKTIQNVSRFPSSELARMAKSTWEFAQANHTRERFAQKYKETIEKIIANQRNHENFYNG
jgi:glycosyltransferase involved in cell wall biosynthesis